MTNSLYSHLECHLCGKVYDKKALHSFCPEDNQPLVARYDLTKGLSYESLSTRENTLWKYKELLPILNEENIVSLGEGSSPMLSLNKLGSKYNQQQLLLKEEGGNPTGSFKARGLCLAVSKAKELGVKQMCIPTAGNAGSALSAYCAKAGIKAHIFMPEATPKVFQLDCEIMGAEVTKVKGNISDAAAQMRATNPGTWFDVTTLKEPFRLEGKKTMGYEIAEQMNWQLPDVIIYPTGGGTGLIGIWKAIKEMQDLGWIKGAVRPRMVAVQGSGCNPVVQAYNSKLDHTDKYENPSITIANGLRVPKAFGDRLIMKTIYESKGCAIDVSDDEIKMGLNEFAAHEGVFLSPEGAAVWIAYKKLRSSSWVKENETVVMLNTGSAYKYVENLY